MLKKELRVLHTEPQAAGRESDARPGLSTGNLKALGSDPRPPIRRHLLIVPLPVGVIFIQTTILIILKAVQKLTVVICIKTREFQL